jgi:hypothetical protein
MKAFAPIALERDEDVPEYLINQLIHGRLLELATLA